MASRSRRVRQSVFSSLVSKARRQSDRMPRQTIEHPLTRYLRIEPLESRTLLSTVTNNDTVGFTVTPTSGLVTTETGGTATFTIVLNAMPSADVTVPLSSSDPSEGSLSPASVTFTPANWSLPQIVTVTGVDDAIVDGPAGYTIITGVAQSADTNYSGKLVPDISVTNTDDDSATLTLAGVSATQMEGTGGTTTAFTFSVTLSAAVQGGFDVTYTTDDRTATVAENDYVDNDGSLHFDGTANESHTITVLVNHDATVEADELFSVALGAISNLAPPQATITTAGTPATGTIQNDDSATLTLAGVSATQMEGTGGTTTAFTFSVTLSAAVQGGFDLAYTTNDGTATAVDGDYGDNDAWLHFDGTANESHTITVLVNDDPTVEADELFSVALGAISNLAPPQATITTAGTPATGTIQNDDILPILAIHDVWVPEGINATFTVTLSAASDHEVTVNYATADQTAVAPLDYVPAFGTLTFAPGQMVQTITVVINDDTIAEMAETFFVDLWGATNATISWGQATVMIGDDDQAVISVVATEQAVEDATDGLFTISTSKQFQDAVSVILMISGTAMMGADYTWTTMTVTIPAYTSSWTIPVRVIADDFVDAEETVTITLESLAGGTDPQVSISGTENHATVTITDDDATPSLSIGDATVTEGNWGTVQATFTVTLSAQSRQTVTVSYATAPGTATAGADYHSATGAISFLSGETSKSFSVLVNTDTLDEPDETFFVNLSSPVNAILADGEGQGTILDDDPVPSLSIGDISVTEGNSGTTAATFTVTLSAASERTVTVGYGTSNGTAQEPGDYQSVTGLLTFTPGQTSHSITVLVNGDTIDEPDETFFVNLWGATSATIADSEGVGTIINDDGPRMSVWDGEGTDGLFSTPENWVGNVPPQYGADLVFPVTAFSFACRNDLPSGS